LRGTIIKILLHAVFEGIRSPKECDLQHTYFGSKINYDIKLS